MAKRADGWITIAFKGDTKQLEKDIKDVQRKLVQSEKEGEKLATRKIKVDADLQEYEKQREIVKQNTEERLTFAQTEDEVNKELRYETEQLGEIDKKYSSSIQELNDINKKIADNSTKQQIYKERISQTNEELKETKKRLNFKNSLGSISSSMEGIIKKVTRWGLAIFGIRSIYNFIRQSISTLSQYDNQLATDMEYIRWALAMSIKPIIDWIIKAVYTLIQLAGSLIQSIFGVNIFANASADAFRKAKDNLSGTNKEAKKLQKTLAGFDEMNVLNDNGSVTQAGAITPTVNLGDIADNSTIRKLKNFWADIFNFWERDWKDIFNNLGGRWGSFISGLILTVKGFWDVLKGIGEVIIGLVQMIVGIVTGNFDLVKKGFSVMIDGIKNILMGAIEIITGALLTVFGFVKGLFLEIWDFFYKILIKPIMDVLNKASSWVNEKVSGVVIGIKNAFKGISNWIENNVTGPIGKFFGNLWDGITRGANGVYDTIKWIFDKLISVITAPLNLMIDGVNLLIDGLNAVNPFGKIAHIPKLGQKKDVYKGGGGFRAKGGIFYPSKLPKLALGGIINQPGTGVPYNGAYIGERGAEAVVPLTDSQQMQLLGEAIGRYITVNLTNVTELDGRTIARKVAEVNSNTDFLLNR